MALLALRSKNTGKAAPAAAAARGAVSRYVPPTFAPEHPVPAKLARKLKLLGRRFFLVRLGERLARGGVAALAVLALQMTTDWLLNLTPTARGLILCGDAALLVFASYAYLLELFLRPLGQEASALLVEKQWPELRGRLIATVQLAGPRSTRDSPELLQALHRETEARAVPLDFREIVPTRHLGRWAASALAVGAVWLCLLLAAAPTSLALLRRVFLAAVEIPRQTEVVCLSGDQIIPLGGSGLFEAEARGVVPPNGLVTLTDASGRIQEVTLDPDAAHRGRFRAKVDRLNEPITYVIRLNDGLTRPYRVEVVPRPYVAGIECEQVYPAYTGLPNAKRAAGNLSLLVGSRLKIHATEKGKIARASLLLIGQDRKVPLTAGGARGEDLTGEIDIPPANLTGFSILLTDAAGALSGSDTQYRIELVPDRPPAVTLNYPEVADQLATLKAKPAIGFLATDDFGLASVTLCYRVSHAPDAEGTDAPAAAAVVPETGRIEMDLGPGRPLTLQRRYQFDPALIKPPVTEGMIVEYWLEARDGNTVTGPGIGESEHHTIRMVSEMEFRADVMRRLNEDLGVASDLLDSQKKANVDLGAVIQDKNLPK